MNNFDISSLIKEMETIRLQVGVIQEAQQQCSEVCKMVTQLCNNSNTSQNSSKEDGAPKEQPIEGFAAPPHSP